MKEPIRYEPRECQITIGAHDARAGRVFAPRQLAARIREARVAARRTQLSLAVDLGVDGSTVCHWECGRATVTVESLALLAIALNVSADYLLFGRP